MTVRRIALFDLDNTLTDHTTAFTLWAAEFSGATGVPVPWLLKAEERHDGARHRFFEEIKNVFGVRESIAALHGAYRQRSAELVPHRPEVCAAVKALVEDGWGLGVVTNGAPDAQRAKLEVAQLDQYFGSVVISGEYGVRKPDPELFRVALDELHARAGTGAAMVGDCLATDVEGGLRAGLHTVWVAGERARLPSDPMPTRTVQTVVEAVDWLRTAALSPARAPALMV
ncbi:HAD family hydrolase [Streptomyces canus]|uniref:HAD family hydrolase n=1 Tax=Streptomyces canus TaxID=58343 RepID=UPI0027871253|nr:HAD family hydrolase [Streptomyces canus]MDQ0765585.1 HAD superfamily hydrolase (TIGR01509 family) [Streptomyces canus]